MEKEKSKIQVVDRETKQVLFECEMTSSEKAYQYAASMEDMGLDVEVISPTLSQTLSSSLGLSREEMTAYEESLEEEMEGHEGSCCFEDAEKIVKDISCGTIDIIIGTQMISKGYDFANLNLVGIVDADSMLYSSDLRALERAYQVFTQVMGRAGRRDESGKIIIQTFNPQNLLFEKIALDDKKNFYDFELNNRQQLNLPPFTQMARFEISAQNEQEAKNFAKNLIKYFPINDKIEVFGPAPAPLQKLKNRHHFLIHLKVDKKVNLQKLINDIISKIEIPNKFRLRININPF
jgi:primosomal protein N' (replication factor Y)